MSRICAPHRLPHQPLRHDAQLDVLALAELNQLAEGLLCAAPDRRRHDADRLIDHRPAGQRPLQLRGTLSATTLTLSAYVGDQSPFGGAVRSPP